MLAKNESHASGQSALNAPVCSRSSIIAAQLGGKSKIKAIEPAAELPFRPVATATSKPRMTLAEFQANQAAANAEADKLAKLAGQVAVNFTAPAAPVASESPIAELNGMSEADLLRKLAEYDRLKMQAKLLYQQCDILEADILEAMRPGDIVTMTDGRRATIVDNFDGIDKNTGKRKNKSWKVAGVSRFEIEFTKSGK